MKWKCSEIGAHANMDDESRRQAINQRAVIDHQLQAGSSRPLEEFRSRNNLGVECKKHKLCLANGVFEASNSSSNQKKGLAVKQKLAMQNPNNSKSLKKILMARMLFYIVLEQAK